jgi:hypothetical protein
MPKDVTVSEFDQLLKDLVINQDPAAVEAFLSSPAPVQAPVSQPEPVPVPVESVVASPVSPEAKEDSKAKALRPPVEKLELNFPGFPFPMNKAVEKGYLNILFSKFSKSFLYFAQIEAFVRFCQAHGDEFLAYLKSQGVK